MNILALDIGTALGYAYNHGPDFYAGTWKLASSKEITNWHKVRIGRRKDPRVQRLCDKLVALGRFDVLVWEDVEFSSSRMATQLWSALRSSIWICGLADYFDCVNAKTLKKFAGYGGADKDYMRKALYAKHPKMLGHLDDNGIDAAWLWHWANENLKRIPTQHAKIPHHD